ncbi:MAG: phosphate acyltransferase PlsX [Planctomycetota bacterium]|jgi:glycerol-3-phosphate acyltransferase PlsX
MRLAIDAMGTDNGHMTILQGVKEYLASDSENEVLVVGREDDLSAGLDRLGISGHRQIKIINSSQIIEMEDKIGALREKKDSSIARLVRLVKEGEADSMVALGNTMAAVACSRLGLGHLPGIHRAGIAVPMPSRYGACVVIDMGANVNVKPKHLYTYGVMASAYSELVLGTEKPKVGLLNVGEEDVKGTEVQKEAFAMLKDAPINFVGNVEGSGVFNGECDVVVCDGFVGNVILKSSEAIATAFADILKDALTENIVTKVGALLSRSAFKTIKKKANYDQYGGAPLLGVNGICIIGHGKSNATAVMNALRVARDSVACQLNRHIQETITDAVAVV